MNPDTNKFEKLEEKRILKETMKKLEQQVEARRLESMKEGYATLVRPDGSPVPEHWSVFQVGENVVIKNYTFKVGYIGESTLLLEPVGPVVVGQGSEESGRHG